MIVNSSNLLARNARKYPKNEAVICQGRRITYEQLHDQVNRLSNSLLNLGIEIGDKVIIFMPNVLEFVVSYFAIQRIGGIVVPINAKFTLTEVEYIADHCEAKAIIAHETIFSSVENFTNTEIKIKTGEKVGEWISYNELIESGTNTEITCYLKEDDLSTILYTSGTTGQPKGVLFSYRNILAVSHMIAIEMEVKPESRMLLMMPLTHSAPLHLFFMSAILVGATNVLTPTFTPDLLIETVEKEKTTHFFGAPVAYLLTANHPKLQTANLSSMKWWVYGGAPLSEKEVRHIQKAFHNLTCVYGLTEAGPSGSILFNDEHEKKAGSVGKRAPYGTELRIINEEGNDVEVGEIGEIILYGEGNMVGYYRNEEETKKVLLNGWIKTGDLARFDEDGYIWIVDRKKDIIISGGVTIYPKEIEERILQFDHIVEVAVVGVPHKEWGETIKAVYAATKPIDKEQLQQYLLKHLAKFKVPKIYEQVDALPRNASGKVLKHLLK